MKNPENIIPEYDTYLFDVDGTLIDTADLVVKCFLYTIQTCRDKLVFDKEITADEIKSLMGLPLRYQMELFFGPMTDNKYSEIHKVYSEYQEKIYLDYLALFPGVKETLADLKSAGKKLGIVTSRRMISLRCYTDAMDISMYFDEFITPEATTKHKPDAAPVLEAIKRLNADPRKTVFIGDALFDIQSGVNAGIDTVYVNWGHKKVSELEVQPAFCIDAMDNLTN